MIDPAREDELVRNVQLFREVMQQTEAVPGADHQEQGVVAAVEDHLRRVDEQLGVLGAVELPEIEDDLAIEVVLAPHPGSADPGMETPGIGSNRGVEYAVAGEASALGKVLEGFTGAGERIDQAWEGPLEGIDGIPHRAVEGGEVVDLVLPVVPVVMHRAVPESTQGQGRQADIRKAFLEMDHVGPAGVRSQAAGVLPEEPVLPAEGIGGEGEPLLSGLDLQRGGPVQGVIDHPDMVARPGELIGEIGDPHGPRFGGGIDIMGVDHQDVHHGTTSTKLKGRSASWFCAPSGPCTGS